MHKNVVSERHVQAVVFCCEYKCCHFGISWPDTIGAYLVNASTVTSRVTSSLLSARLE